MKVCHIIVALNVGGAERALQRLVLAHRHYPGVQATVISLTTEGTVGAELSKAGVRVVALGIRSPLGVLLGVWRLARLLRELRPDVVQTWMYHADLLGGLAARLVGIRNVLWGIRSTQVVRGSSGTARYVQLVCARLSMAVPRYIVCVARAAKRVHVSLGYAPDRMVVIHNGFDVAAYAPVSPASATAFRQAVGLPADALVVGMAGRYNTAKDVPNFVGAASLLARQHDGLRFVMLGRHMDGGNAELMGLIAAAGLVDRFVLLGERRDMPACMGLMDVFCLASRTEAFPNVVGEAMAVGVPCVVTDVGDAALIVGDTGVVVPKEDARALAQGLSGLLSMSAEQRRALGMRARERVTAVFSAEQTVQAYDDLYNKVVADGLRGN